MAREFGCAAASSAPGHILPLSCSCLISLPPTLPVQSAALPSKKCIFWETCGVPCVCPPRSNCVLLRPVTIKAQTVILCGALSLRRFSAREKTAFRVGYKAFKFGSPGSPQLCQGAARGKEWVEMLTRGPAEHHALHTPLAPLRLPEVLSGAACIQPRAFLPRI